MQPIFPKDHPMLETILNFLQKQLANQLASRLSSNLPLVTLSNLTKLDGSPVTELDNTLVLTLLNVEKEAAAPKTDKGEARPAGTDKKEAQGDEQADSAPVEAE